MFKVMILLAMVFCHIVDDYYLQGWLASAKQKKWWEENAPDKMYRNDYIVALFMHAFSWSFMIHVPLVLYSIYLGVDDLWMVFLSNIVLQMVIHAIVDHLKANRKVINLIQDQLIHLGQIAVTFIIYYDLLRSTNDVVAYNLHDCI